MVSKEVWKFFITVIVYILYYLMYKLFFLKMNSNKDIIDKALGRPAMMAFIILLGTYVTTGQLIPGIYWIKSVFQYWIIKFSK